MPMGGQAPPHHTLTSHPQKDEEKNRMKKARRLRIEKSLINCHHEATDSAQGD